MDFTSRQKFYIALGFFLYLIATLVFMGVHKWWSSELVNQDFYISFIASSWEDMLFFGLVGALVMIFGIRSPKQDALLTRIENLFTFEDHDKVKRSIQQTIERLAVYSPKNDILIYIDLYCEEKKAYKLIIYQTLQLKNLIHDLEYTYRRNVDFEIDPIENIGEELYGRINEITFTNQNHVEEIVEQNKQIVDNKVSYSIEEKLAKGGSATTKLHFWFWQKSDKSFNYTTHHTSENTTIQIKNCITNIKPKIIFNDLEHELASEEQYAICKNEFLKQDGIVEFKII